MSALVSIITVNYNQHEATCALLDSIRRQNYRHVEVIVVDNGSRHNPIPELPRRYPEVRWMRSARNLGFAGANNLAIRVARGEYLFFLNNDTEIADGCIENLLELLQNQPEAGMVSPLICYFPENPQQQTLIQYAGMTPVHPLTGRNTTIGHREPDAGQFDRPRPTAYAHGAAMMTSRQVVDTVGLMPEDFFLYYEELDWCAQMQRSGYSIWVEPRARVFHKESLTLSQMGALKTFYLFRNRVLFMRRNFKGWRLAMFYLFYTAVVVPKNTMMFLLKGEWAQLLALWRSGFYTKPVAPVPAR